MNTSAVVTKAPCSKCPFRKDVPIYLTAGRREEIALVLANGGDFHCHATVEYDTGEYDEEGDELSSTAESSLCSGAMKATMLAGGSNQMLRIAERLGLVDQDEVEERGVDVWSLTEWTNLAEGATDEDYEEIEGETCAIVGPGCEAPAGYMGASGGIVRGTVFVDEWCYICGDPVCDSCVGGSENSHAICLYCAEGEDDE